MNGVVLAPILAVLAGLVIAFQRANRTRRPVRPVNTGDPQGDAYVAILIAAKWRQRKRIFDTRGLEPVPPGTQGSFDPYRPPKWPKLEADLAAFGSDSVRAAAEAASSAHLAAMKSFEAWTSDHSEYNGTAALRARKAADDADNALADRIRLELQAKGMPLPDGLLVGPAGDGA